MSKRTFVQLAGGMAALVWIVPAAVQAAPANVGEVAAGKTIAVEEVADRSRPRNAKGSRVYGYTSFGPKANSGPALSGSYGMPQPSEVPYGSSAWWRA
jgi:hypothetical protein